MKIRNSIYILAVGAFLVSCNDLDVDDSVDFIVSLASDNTYEAGDPVVFNFDGNPDYITWWSGEEGHKYANRERTELPLEEIESVTLNFEAQARYGKVTNTLSLFVGDFPGLSKDVATDDSRVADFESDATLLSGNGELLESKFSYICMTVSKLINKAISSFFDVIVKRLSQQRASAVSFKLFISEWN